MFAVIFSKGQVHESPNGNVGIGTTNPTEKLHISSSTSGDTVLRLESDTDNNNEGNNPRIEFLQDGGLHGAFIGFNNEWGGSSVPDNIFRIGIRAGGVNYYDALTIDPYHNYIGIGTPAPTAKLDLRGDFYMDAGEGFRVFGDVNYFGEWRDGIVFEMRDGNSTNGGTDGGFVFRGYTPTDNVFKDWMVIRSDGGGRVGIGTTTPDAKLAVKGNIHAQEVKVDLNGAVAPDYVFNEGYDLRSLQEVQDHIKEHGHLPNIPSAQEMEANGIDLGQMNLKLLEKIEELTLYLIQFKKENEQLKIDVEKLKKRHNDN